MNLFTYSDLGAWLARAIDRHEAGGRTEDLVALSELEALLEERNRS